MKISPLEVASRYVYPSLRRRLVGILREKGLKQTEIASLLHITQSAVSRYLRMNRGALIDVSSFPDVDSLIKGTADWILNERPSEYAIQKRLMEIAVYMLGKGYVCSFHSKIDPELDPKRCRVCLELFGSSE
ncbi:transcriptional regulator [Thermococcus peptonophilus]|uniref:Transcriptional regulator n=1 Tax=Thermococcus peptonophilus TaxID=53952 RepID=A0A142CX43_9EURY|nr:ArsR family transcriptional regulator [Thermococcus peptonophilus]AMQ19345.1 transcriptional regulator [Thermococcus peptonophilus]